MNEDTFTFAGSDGESIHASRWRTAWASTPPATAGSPRH